MVSISVAAGYLSIAQRFSCSMRWIVYPAFLSLKIKNSICKWKASFVWKVQLFSTKEEPLKVF